MSGAGVLSILPIARLNKPPRRLSVESYLQTSNPPSILKDEDLLAIRGRYGFPSEVLLDFLSQTNEQTPCWRDGSASDKVGVELSVDDILALYYPQKNLKDHGQYSMYPRRKKQVVGEMKNADSNELKKPPPKALIFEEKLERMLAQLNQEGALRRLFGTPLFIEPLSDEEALIAELVLDTMDVDFPNPKDLLARKKAQKEAAKAAAAEKAAQAGRATEPQLLLVIKSSSEPSAVPVQSPAKKRKADKKLKRKVPAKRKKTSKVSTFKMDVEPRGSLQEGQKIKVDLPPGTSILQNKRFGVGIMRQLLSDVDSDTINEGRIQSHLDEFLWDGLKMKVMVDIFDEATAKIKTLEESLKQKEADNSVLVACIVDAYERATLKARNDLLKKFRQGLLVDVEVEEEIEMYKDYVAEAGDSLSAPVTAAPTVNEPEPVIAEPLSNVDPSKGHETHQ
ncbi:hypothetical protein TIFTF001_040502 [Ficus carica]|uniref:Uncharacterized protein n=1 Tax=Ficus carica TaxID=3494 RepID=A0AA87Z1L3_FICCA|nr:hypothetical protein TIFTF001_040502 [Ficus carica]